MYIFWADLVLIVHLAFVVFVLGGGLLMLKWRWIAWLHLPAALWGAVVEFTGEICPLTPLENWLRAQDGDIPSSSDSIAQYLLPVLYPGDLTRGIQWLFGSVVVILNSAVYWWIWRGVPGEKTELTNRHTS